MRGSAYVWCAIVLALGSASAAQAATITDNFDTAHDYLTGGVIGTVWAGVRNAGNASVLDADTTNYPTGADGVLTVGSNLFITQTTGPFLYMNVSGPQDFVATVRTPNVSGGNYSTAGLLVVDPSNPSNQVSVTGTSSGPFTKWNYDLAGNYDMNYGPYTGWWRIERESGVFSAFYSSDGSTWAPFPHTNSPSSLAGAVQVGLGYATWGAISGGRASFDNFSLTDNSSVEDIPEPCTLILLSAGLSSLVGRAWRRRK